ncbi:MAG TPA: hypothetical protein VLL74_01095 [Methanoregula sp.]|nr:hypothetical protein [Methanoregula sp.]
MIRPILPALVLLILICAVLSGCMADPETPVPVTNAPPATPVTVVVTSATPLPATTVEPVRTLPPERGVNLVLTKDRPTSEIHLLYQGGPGDMLVTRVMMRVYTSETAFEEYIMSNGKKPVPGDAIIAPGTRGGDRCEVIVISSGTRYKVLDEPVYGGMYY